MAARLVVALALVLVLAVLWAMPAALFSNPGANDAIGLAFLGPLLYLFTLVGCGLTLLGVRRLALRAEVPFGLGVFLVGLVPAFVLAIVTFGNFSNDRFAPLFLTPILALSAGIVILVLAILVKPTMRQVVRGCVFGAVAAILVAAWIQIQGAADWLQAPYGFDTYVLIAVAALSITNLGMTAHDTRPLQK